MARFNSTFTNFLGFDTIAASLPAVGTIGFNDGTTPAPSSSQPSSSTSPGFVPRIELASGLSGQAAARNIFAATQGNGNTNFNSHAAIRMLVTYMKKTIRDGDYRWRQTNLQQTVFPSFPAHASPDYLSVSGLNDGQIRQGACALLVKAFYNACRDYNDRINLSKANQHVADVNAHISNQKAQLLVQYYRWAFAIAPTADLVDRYTRLLLSGAYRNLKVAQASFGTWVNSNLEMFCHLVKLSACGASDQTIARIYGLFCFPNDGTQGVDPGYFSEISPSTWRNYSGWLSPGLLDFSDLNATNLTSYYSPPSFPTPGGGFSNPVPITLVDTYVTRNDYSKPKSSSCFAASTPVLMASGELRPISKVKAGDIVATRPPGASQVDAKAEVMFVSQTPRQNRNLYSFKNISGVAFTDAHPFADSSNPATPTVSFVDSLTARCINPLWRLLDCSTFDPGLMTEHVADETTKDEILYDLIFKQNLTAGSKTPEYSFLPRYVVGDTKNGYMITFSEAPIASWLPLESVFAQHVIGQIMTQRGSLAGFIALFDTDGSFACQLLDGLASKVQPSDLTATPTTPSPIKDFSTFLTQDAQGQLAASFIEKLLARVGCLPSNIVSLGWLGTKPASDPGNEPALKPMLLLRRLQFLTTDHIAVHVSKDMAWTLRLWQDEKLVVEHELHATYEGPLITAFHEAFTINEATNANEKSDSADSSDEGSTFLRFELVANHKDDAFTLTGQGRIIDHCDTWVNLIGSNEKSLPDSHTHAVIQVEIQQADESTLTARHDWTDAQMVTMAALLGRRFGDALLKRMKESANEPSPPKSQ